MSSLLKTSVELGVDTGGTFTDFVWLDRHGQLRIYKRLSTPKDPSLAIVNGIEFLGVPSEVTIVHGSTVATNALLERKGARTALITTKGFADLIEIGRQDRPDLYELVPRRSPPLVPREMRFEIPERVGAQGEIILPLDLTSLPAIANQLREYGIEAIAICYLFSYLHPDHERLTREAVQHLLATSSDGEGHTVAQDIHISISSEILPEFREYERASTTVINAYVSPMMNRYLSRLENILFPRRVTILQSNGGSCTPSIAGSQAARTVLSGPAGGVVGARFIATTSGYDDLITFDMGGTSTDVALCQGKLPMTTEGSVAGFPMSLPMIDIHTVGSGGGSLAYLDSGGALHVGPESAGAAPGPACYGLREPVESPGTAKNSSWATTTDANLVLGRLDANHFLGGEMTLAESEAEKVIELFARAMGLHSLKEAAWGIIRVANANMERAMRLVSVERGHDPRFFTMVAFGGAGPLHACELADQLRIPRILVPFSPGVLSALGMLTAYPTRDYSQTTLRKLVRWDLDGKNWLIRNLRTLEQKARYDMGLDGYESAKLEIRPHLDMRYVGQSHELNIPLAGSPGEVNPITLFHETHQRRYTYQMPEAPVEIVNIRLTVFCPIESPKLPEIQQGDANAVSALIGTKDVWFEGGEQSANLYDRALLKAGNRFDGPAVIYQYDTTTLIPPEWRATVRENGALELCRASL